MTTQTATEYLACIDCQRPMRPYNSTAADHPGTVCRAGKNCSTCANTKAARRKMDGIKCTDCNKPLRPKGTKASKYPGTIPHQAGGKCRPCHQADPAVVNERLAIRLKTSELGDTPEGLTGKDAKARAALEAYMNRRRARHIPAAGIPLDMWIHRTAVAA